MTAGSKPSFRFVALMAFLVSAVALGIDLMLASLPEIGEELSPADPERSAFVMGSFFMALGVATFLVGPLLDAFGRRPVIIAGLGLYVVGAVLSWLAPSLGLMLLGRALMGLGAAAPRVGVQAVIRDRFEGRQMASTISLVMMIFTLVPGVAPMLGAWVADAFGWRAVFGVFIAFGLISLVWFILQQPETLKKKQPLEVKLWMSQTRESLADVGFRHAMSIQLFIFGCLFGFLTTGPAIFTYTYELETLYPYIFGAVSLSGALAAFVNSRLVHRFGMVRLIRWSLVVCALTAGISLAAKLGGAGIAAFLIPMFMAFFVLAFVIGNSQALALQPLGHIAGTASATIVAAATLGAGLISMPVALYFEGSPTAMLAAQLLYTLIALYSAYRLKLD